MEINKDRQATHRLSSSGKAVLTYDEQGNTFMTSVAWMKMLLEGRANGNMIKSNYIGSTSGSRFNKRFEAGKVQSYEGDPLSKENNVSRNNNKVVVDGDW